MPSDAEIAAAATLRPIVDVAADLGLADDDLIPYGRHLAKVHLDALGRAAARPRGRYVGVTAITPTPLGEGKTTTAIGLVDALAARGATAVACLRQPSLGPTFGIKGGASGGGRSQVAPADLLNLHLTGDVHAIGAAHNLVAAAVDARLYHEARLDDGALAGLGLRRLDLDPFAVSWRRVLDVNDRALRHVVVGLGGPSDGVPRESAFDITVASELMAILALVDGDGFPAALRNLRERVARIVVGTSRQGRPVTLEDLGAAGAVTALLRDALHPNLLQTLAGRPVFVHAGPFANIAHGNSSILADRLGLHVADYVVTESGFGSDMGLEKLVDIKCRTSGLRPDCIVLVATVRALKTHGGGPRVVPGRPLDRAYTSENLALLEAGLPNLVAHVEIVKRFGLPVVVAVNRFPTDTSAEAALVEKAALEAGAAAAVTTEHWARGADGAAELAEAVEAACGQPNELSYLYPLHTTVRQKIEIIARDVYGADGVEILPTAGARIDELEKAGHGYLPVCMAKTHLSLSHDPARKGAPRGFTVPVRDVRLAAGAGFITALCGEISTMPGLGSTPNYTTVDVDEAGNITGLL